MPNSSLHITPVLPHSELASTPQVPLTINQRSIAVDAGQRTQLLRYLIEQNGWRRVLVFVATKHAAEMVADKLRKAGLGAEPFHEQLSRGKRTQVLLDFKAERLSVVVATGVAEHDLDGSRLPVLVNYDLPRSALDYAKRLRRSGLTGESSTVLSFVSADTEAHFSLIEKRQAQKLPREQIAGFEPLQAASAAAPSTGGIKGKRPNKKDKLRAAVPSI